VLNGYAYLLALTGQSLNEARDVALRASEIAPEHPEVEHTLALISYRSGDVKTARTYIEQSMDHGGGDDYRTLEHYGDILFSSGEVEQAVEHWQLSQDRGNPSEVLKRKIVERRLVH